MKLLLLTLLLLPALGIAATPTLGNYNNAATFTGTERFLTSQGCATLAPCTNASTVEATPPQLAAWLIISGNMLPAFVNGDCLSNNGTTALWATCGGSGSWTGTPASPPPIGTGTANSGVFTTLAAISLGLTDPLTASNGGLGSSSVPSAGQLPVGNSGGTAYAPLTLSGDCTLSSAGVITCTHTGGTAFGALATLVPGTGIATWLVTPTPANLNTALGVTLPLLTNSQTWTQGNIFTNANLAVQGSSTGYTAFQSENASATNYSIEVPANTGVIAELNLAQTFTAINTFAGLIDSALTAGTSPVCPNGTSGALTTSGCIGGATLQTNGTNNSTQSNLNIENGVGITCSNPSAGNVQCNSAYAVRTVTGATGSITSADCANGVYFSYAGAVAVSSPAPTGSSCGIDISASSVTTVTVTPASGTINGNATLVVGPSLWAQTVDAASGNYLGYGTAISFNAGVTYLLDEGTKFTATGTGACLTADITTSGGTATGKFVCTGTSGASTIIIALPTAPNGIWHCSADDETTSTDTWRQTAHSSTSVTLSGTIVSGDTSTFGPCGGS
jgi:hypothetical protein